MSVERARHAYSRAHRAAVQAQLADDDHRPDVAGLWAQAAHTWAICAEDAAVDVIGADAAQRIAGQLDAVTVRLVEHPRHAWVLAARWAHTARVWADNATAHITGTPTTEKATDE